MRTLVTTIHEAIVSVIAQGRTVRGMVSIVREFAQRVRNLKAGNWGLKPAYAVAPAAAKRASHCAPAGADHQPMLMVQPPRADRSEGTR